MIISLMMVNVNLLRRSLSLDLLFVLLEKFQAGQVQVMLFQARQVPLTINWNLGQNLIQKDFWSGGSISSQFQSPTKGNLDRLCVCNWYKGVQSPSKRPLEFELQAEGKNWKVTFYMYVFGGFFGCR